MSTSIELSGVTVRYSIGGSTVTALNHVDVRIQPGEFVTVIGSNGAGKSTLVNVIAGTVRAEEGEIRIGKRVITRLAEHKRAKLVSRVFQGTTAGICTELTVLENLMLARSRGHRRSMVRPAVTKQHRKYAAQVLASYGMGLETRLDQIAGLLSGGQQQLLGLAMAGASESELLLLDEHTSALDPNMAEEVIKATDRMVRDTGISTLMVTHNMRHSARFGDRLLIMSAGRIVGEISDVERTRLGEQGLIDRFREVVSEGVRDDMLA